MNLKRQNMLFLFPLSGFCNLPPDVDHDSYETSILKIDMIWFIHSFFAYIFLIAFLVVAVGITLNIYNLSPSTVVIIPPVEE